MALLCVGAAAPPAVLLADAQGGPPRLASARSGRWSDPATWQRRSVPGAGAAVVIARRTKVEYDIASERELTSLDVEGALVFSRSRSTRLDTGNIVVRDGGALEIGSADRPIPPSVTTEIRLVVPAGATFRGGDFVPGDVGIWIFGGGRWDLHGAPIRHTWTKLARVVRPGDRGVVVGQDVTDWPAGATVMVTPTGRSPQAADFEERTVERVLRLPGGLYEVRLRTALERAHDGGGAFSGEIALLTRNVRIMSKYPDRVKAHTMYMAGARGGISYGEFRDLGARGVLGRYPLHFHLMGDTSRGMVLRGASIWRSDNHFLNIHGSSGITIEDTVGYDVPGAGFFLEPVGGRSGRQESRQQSRDKRERRPEERPAPPSPAASPGDKRKRGEEARDARLAERRERASGQRPRKGEEPFGNVDNVFVHNLAAKAIWRPGALEDRRRVALFWIGAFNTTLIDNVAVGALGGRDFSGFHLAEEADVSFSQPPLAMVGNEAHSNGAHGFFSWTNSKLAFDIVGFTAWRNGRSGVALGAYNHRFRLFNATLAENGEHNVTTWVVRPWIQDSVLRAAPVGIFFNPREVPGSPDDPGRIINTRFAEHRDADVAQDHRSCPSPEQEREVYSRACPANYAVFVRPQFLSRRAIDFGWHESAHTWLDVLEWATPPAGMPSSFRLMRKDQRGQTGWLFEPFEAWLQPLTRAVDVPPHVEISAAPEPRNGGGITVRALARDDQAIAAVEFFVDAVMVRRTATPPYQLRWSPQGRLRRSAYVYARAVDSAGNVAYSRVLRLGPSSP